MNPKEFKKALDLIVAEKKLDASVVVDAMNAALATAYKKNYNEPADIRSKIDLDTGQIRVYKVLTVMNDDDIEDDVTQISVEDAKQIDSSYEIGDEIVNEVETEDFDRVAVGVAKQVVLQKIREAERELIMADFADKESEIMVGFVAMEDVKNYYIDLGKTRGILPKSEIIPDEKIEMGSSIKVYISKIESTPKGPFILLSRKHTGFIKKLFELEIPEFADGTLIINGIAREAGVRTKVAVSSTNSKIDAIGSCIGEKGRRIGNIIKELGGEKVDLVLYSDDAEEYIAHALSPAKNLSISIEDEKEKTALVIADNENLSLAIGKKGINIKLASRLTRYKINVKTISDINKEINEQRL